MEPQPDENAGDGSGIEADIAEQPTPVAAKLNARTSKKKLVSISE